MANREHINILRQGVEAWNTWRERNGIITPDLHGAYLMEANFTKIDFRGTDLVGTYLTGTNLAGANLGGANLSRAVLSGANLGGVDLVRVNLSEANLRGTILRGASLINTNLINATLTGCHIFGISAWNVNVAGAIQQDLVITEDGEPEITVDNLEVAQFIYLLLNNQKIRAVIDTIAKKVVLILGRFTDERKDALDALRDELRQQNYSPILFDFEKPSSRNLTETISTLAHMSRFVIADLTDAKSLPQELERIVPHLPSVPIQPILHKDDTEYAMFEHYARYPWVLPIYRYQNISSLLASIKEHIIQPVEQKMYREDEKRVLEEEIRKLREENKRLKGV